MARDDNIKISSQNMNETIHIDRKCFRKVMRRVNDVYIVYQKKSKSTLTLLTLPNRVTAIVFPRRYAKIVTCRIKTHNKGLRNWILRNDVYTIIFKSWKINGIDPPRER